MKTKSIHTLGMVLFFFGILLGLTLFSGLTWAGLEGTLYFGYGVKGSHRLKLSCPLIMTATETNHVTATVPNTTDRLAEPIFRIDVSQGYALRSERSQIQIAMGEKESISWEVTPDDIVFGHLILVHIYQFQAFLLPSADANCGILVVNIPGLTGTQVYILVVVFSLLSIAGGLAIWIFSKRPLEGRTLLQTRGLIFLAGFVVAGMIISSLGAWGLGLLLVAVSVLMIGIMVGRFIQEQ